MGSPSGGTVWTGTALNCVSTNNEIILLHGRFMSHGSYGSCNNGAIVARSLSTDGNYYTSQLNVTVTPDILGKTIECGYDNLIYSISFQLIVISITGLNSVDTNINFI